jgi:hypothetical protein
MSRLTEIQNQYQGFVAAYKAAEETRPNPIEVIYKEAACLNGSLVKDTEGYFLYNPKENQIEIVPIREEGRRIYLNADDVPALIKALREFFE